MFRPDKESGPDLIASTGDYLRIWEITATEVKNKCLLNNNKNSEYCAPLTSFDWNETDLKRLGTSSIDTTCTIWDIEVIANFLETEKTLLLDMCKYTCVCVLCDGKSRESK